MARIRAGQSVPTDATAQREFMLAGGRGYKVFLGYLFPANHPDSIFNDIGQYGRCLVGTDNIHCHSALSDFGSTFYGARYSACNPSAEDPPAIVDQEGGYYGRFSVGPGYIGHTDSVCATLGQQYVKSVCDIVTAICGQKPLSTLQCVPRSQCCKVCSKGKACGDSCISQDYDCHKGRGCGCDAEEVCSSSF
jgi:hypothetical protein